MKTILLILSLALFGSANAQSPSFLWAKSAGGTNYDDGNSIATDANGNVFVTGYFQSPTITFGTTTLINGGNFDFFIVKYDASGNVIWAKSAGGSRDDVGNSITTDANGNVFVTGYFYSPTITFGTTILINPDSNSNDIFIVKYDANGNVMWAKNEGGTYYEYGKSISTDTNGNVYVTGNFSSTTFSIGTDTLTNNSMFGWDIFVVKYNTHGNVLWAKGAGGTGGEFSGGITTNQNGDVFVTGYFYGPSLTFGNTTVPNNGLANMDSDIFVAKYDANGNVLWAKSEGAANNDVANDISIDANGNVFVAGNFKGPSFTFGTTTLTNSSSDNYDVLLAKYDASGNSLWARSSVGNGNEFARSISTEANGDILVTGSFYSPSITFGATTLTNSSNNHSDIFVVKYDNAGNVLWEQSVGGANNDVGFGITSDAAGGILLTGYFHSPSITLGTTTLTNTGGSVLIAKLGNAATGIDDLSRYETLNIFPNPTSHSTTIRASGILNNANLIVYNSTGKKVQESKNISGQSVILSLDMLANGLYFIQLTEGNKTYRQKLAVSNK